MDNFLNYRSQFVNWSSRDDISLLQCHFNYRNETLTLPMFVTNHVHVIVLNTVKTSWQNVSWYRKPLSVTAAPSVQIIIFRRSFVDFLVGVVSPSVKMTSLPLGNDCNIQKSILHAGKGDLPSFIDGTKVLLTVLPFQYHDNLYRRLSISRINFILSPRPHILFYKIYLFYRYLSSFDISFPGQCHWALVSNPDPPRFPNFVIQVILNL